MSSSALSIVSCRLYDILGDIVQKFIAFVRNGSFLGSHIESHAARWPGNPTSLRAIDYERHIVYEYRNMLPSRIEKLSQ